MKKLVLLFIAVIAISCSGIKIEDNKTGFNYSKVLQKVPIENQNSRYFQSSYYHPQFYTGIILSTNYTLTNNTKQNFEEYIISNRLELRYKNNFVKTIPLSILTSDSTLNQGESITCQQEFTINELDSFDSKNLIHDAQRVNMIFEVQAANSVGLNLEEKGNNVVKIDLTDEWKKVENFSREYTFQNYAAVVDNYMPQIIGSKMFYEGWHKGISENISILFGKDSKVKSRNTGFYPTDATLWKEFAEGFDIYFDLLFTSFYNDLNSTSMDLNNEFENLWNNWMKQRNGWISTDIKTLELVESYLEKKDSIYNSMKMEPPYYPNSRLKRQRRPDAPSNSNSPKANPNYAEQKHIYGKAAAEKATKIKLVQDSIWLKIVESERNYEEKFESANIAFNDAMMLLKSLNE
uniref:hypothetical protein n=1 Tax=uncultured Draconibacterium sp. TaxID=1573823 RepID=UPI00321743EE